jgi:hypothetical protein
MSVKLVRRLVGHLRSSQGRPYLNVADSYQVRRARAGTEPVSSWIHTHH